MAAVDPLKGINLSLPEIQGAQDPTKALSPDLPGLVNNIEYNNPAPIATPYIPKGTPEGAVEINDQLVGDEHTGPAPGFKNVTRQGTLDLAKGINSYIGQADSWARDKYKYGRTYSYGAGYKNMNFERYYTHPNFEKLGFSPYRDNETVYNENSSWWDDFNRMRHQWGSLWWSGVKSAGVGSLFGGADTSSEEMEKAMAIGSSTKGGAGAFTTNLLLNWGYTAGILSEIAAENLVLTAVEGAALAAEIPSGGTSSAVLVAAAGKQASNFTKVWEAAKGVSRISKYLTELQEIPKAKEAYNAFRLGDKAMDFAKWVNPLKGTTEFATHLAKGTSSFKELGNLSKTVWGFGRFYRDIREIQTVHSEAAMEGASAAHKYHDQLIDEYYNKNGKMPEGKDADEIYQRSQSIRASVTLANDFIIYGSNKIAFEKMFQGLPSVGKTAKLIEEAGTGRTFERTAAKEILTKGAVEVAEDTFAKKAGRFLVSSPYVPWSKAYMAGNIAEALQENAQDIIQDYQKARHDKIYKDPSQAGFWSAINDLGAATGKQWSGQGLETLLSGFLMGAVGGAFQGAVLGGVQKGRSLVSKSYADKIKAAETRAQEYENGIANAVNTLAKTPINFGAHNSDHFATVKNLANEMDNAAKNNDEYSFNNHKDELEFEDLKHLARTKRMDLFIDKIDSMLKLEDEDLTNAYGLKVEDAQKARKILQTRKERAQEFVKQYDSITKEFENPEDPSLFDPEKDPERFARVQERYTAWNNAVDAMLYSVTTSKKVAGRMTSMFNDLVGQTPWLVTHRNGTSIANAGAAAITLTIDNEQRAKEMDALEEEIDALKEGSAEDKKKAKEKQVTLDKLKTWKGALANFDKEINRSLKEQTPESQEFMQTAIEQLRTAFTDYMQHVAKQQGGTILNKQLDKAFEKVKDFYLLNRDQQKLIRAINVLSNPTYFTRYADLEAKAERIRRENHANDIKEAFKKLNAMKSTNKFLNKLFDIGVWIMPEDVETFKTRPRDVTFYDVLNKQFIAPSNKVTIKRDSEKYKQILKVIEDYEKENGITPPAVATPKAEVKVNWATDVDNIKAELAKLKTKEEKLQWLVDNNYIEPFTVNGKTSTYLREATGRVIVKAKIGKITIPFYISTGQGQKADVEINKWYVFFGQGEKGWFNKTSGPDINNQYGVKVFQDIAGILNEVGSNKDEYKVHEDDKGFMDTKWINAAEDQLKKVIDFITPVQPNMVNGQLIATPEQIAKLKENIQTVKDRVAKELAGLTKTEPEKKVEEKPKEEVKPGQKIEVKAITPTTSMEVIGKLEILRDKLVEAYRKENANRKRRKEPQLQNATGTWEDILKTEDFKTFLTTKTAIDILNDYNESTGRVVKEKLKPKEVEVKKEAENPYAKGKSIVFTGETADGQTLNKVAGEVIVNDGPVEDEEGNITSHPVTIRRFDNQEEITIDLEADNAENYIVEPYEEPAAKVPLTITTQIRQQLYDLGYSKIDVDAMKPADAQELIARQTTKVKPEAPVAEEGPSIQEQLDKIEEDLAYLYQDKEAAEIAIEAGEDSFEMYVYKNMPKISPESAQKETGVKTGRGKDINQFFIRNNGVTVEEAAEDVWNDLSEEMQGTHSDSDIRNLIIDMLTTPPKEIKERLTPKGKLTEINRRIKELEAEKKELQKQQTKKKEAKKEEIKEGIEIPEFLAEEFSKVKTVEELKSLLNAKFADPKVREKYNLTSKYMQELEQRLTREMMTNVNFDAVVKETILVTPEGVKYTPFKKTANQIIVQELDKDGFPGENFRTIKKSNFSKTFSLMYTPGLEDVVLTPEITEQEKQESMELIDKVNTIDSPETIINDDEKGAKASSSELDKNLEDLIKSCEE